MVASGTYTRPSGCIIFEVEDAASEFLDCYREIIEKETVNKSEDNNQKPYGIQLSGQHVRMLKRRKQSYPSTFTLDRWTCLSLNDPLLTVCFGRELGAREPLVLAEVTISSFPSFFFFTQVVPACLGLKCFSLLLFPCPFRGLECFG